MSSTEVFILAFGLIPASIGFFWIADTLIMMVKERVRLYREFKWWLNLRDAYRRRNITAEEYISAANKELYK